LCGDKAGTALLRLGACEFASCGYVLRLWHWGSQAGCPCHFPESGGEEPGDERAEVLDGFCGPEVLWGHDGVVEGMVFRP